MPKNFIRTLSILLLMLGSFTATTGHTTETESVAVCIDEQKTTTCLQGDGVIEALYGLRLRTSLGWKIRDDLYVNTVLARLIQGGESPVALFILEEITPDNESDRPQCHACVPRMSIALLNWTDGNWKMLSNAKGLNGIGAWGALNVDNFTLHTAASKQYLLEIRSSYMNQGIIETAAGFFASFDANGKPSTTILDLGGVVTSVSSCDSGFDSSAQEIGQLVIFFKPLQYPDLIFYRTEASCDKDFSMKTLPPQLYVFDKKTNVYSLSNQKQEK